MQIELLLNSVNQDQTSTNPAEVAFTGWLHGPGAGTGSGNDILDKIPKISTRKERWGGLFVYMPTQTVYWTDVDALTLLERLVDGETLQEIRKKPNEIASLAIDEFEGLLKKFNIEYK